MIKEILEQLAPLDAQIAALKGSGNDMEAITAHASELAELAVEEDEILRYLRPADRRGPGLSGPAPGAPPHRRNGLGSVHRFLRAAGRPPVQGGQLPSWAASPGSTGCR